MGSEKVSYCFPLNGDTQNPEINGQEGIMKAYNTNKNRISQMGPTNFADVIKEAKNYVVKNQRNAKMYNILLILTDGLIHDMVETIDEIADISD